MVSSVRKKHFGALPISIHCHQPAFLRPRPNRWPGRWGAAVAETSAPANGNLFRWFPPPSWFLGEPAALRRLASHCGKTVLALGLSIYVSWNVRADDRTGSLASLSIEQLLNESVTSVSKKETKLSESPAAISVITQEDIRRSGMTSVPELLRMVPGLDVARINGNQWAISSRGFNNQYANKLLVLVDGRAVYSPVYGGVFWNAQDVVLEDVDRIEVIRGPGAALWGANAVNGVVNITTKSAKETQGGLVSVSAGTEDQPSTTVRYGGQPRRQCPRLYAPWGPLVGQHRRRRNQP